MGNFEFFIYEDFEDFPGRKDVSPQTINIAAPEIKSISSHEIFSKHPVIVEIENLDLLQFKSLFQMIGYYTSFDSSQQWMNIYYEILNESQMAIVNSSAYRYRAEDFKIMMHFNWDNSAINIEEFTSTYTVDLGIYTSYFNYDFPVYQPYAPGSLIPINEINLYGGFGVESAYIGDYKVNARHNLFIPSNISFKEGDKFEVRLLKEDGFLNLDNSHNFVEIIHGKYRVTEEDNDLVYFETNVEYNYQYISVKAVNQLQDTFALENYDIHDFNDTTKVNFQAGIPISILKPGNYELLINSGNYYLKPAGNIIFTVE